MYWNFVFRSLYRAETVRLETITDDEAEARALAAKHLEAEGRPATAFVSLTPAMAARSIDHADLVAKYGTAAAAVDDGAAMPPANEG